MYPLLSSMKHAKLFVSYTRRDPVVCPSLLAQVVDALAPMGEAFVDCLHNDSADPQQRVLDELAMSSGLVLVQTPSLLHSEWVRLELAKAHRWGIPIVALCVPLSAYDKMGNLVTGRQNKRVTLLNVLSEAVENLVSAFNAPPLPTSHLSESLFTTSSPYTALKFIIQPNGALDKP